jgi:hypothetical protein
MQDIRANGQTAQDLDGSNSSEKIEIRGISALLPPSFSPANSERAVWLLARLSHGLVPTRRSMVSE